MTDEIDELELDADDAREVALERGILEHDTLEFNGKSIRPISAGSMAILERTRNGLILGDASSLLFDAAAFVILHTDDEDLFRAARRAAFSPDWPGYVVDWLDATPEVHQKLIEFAPNIRRMREDYAKTITRSTEGTKPGNAGGRIG